MSIIFSKYIIITGMMGTGKTTIGKLLAKNINFAFFDLDQLIESEAKNSIFNIFSNDGESYFRYLEFKVLNKLLTTTIKYYDNFVLSLGGGAFIQPDIRNFILSKNFKTFWLKADFTILHNRLESSLRPLINTVDSQQRLKQLANLADLRNNIYAEANVHIDGNKPVKEVVCSIMRQLQ